MKKNRSTRWLKIFTAGMLALILANTLAQPANASALGDQIARVPDDLASPVTTPAYIPLAVGAGLTGFFLLTRHSISEPLARSVGNSKPLGSTSKIGDLGGQMLPNIGYAAGELIAYWAGNDAAGNRALMMTLASLYSGGVSTVLKYTVHEQRPNNGNNLSFPSGHASDAFSFASVVGAEHELPWAIAAYGFAGFVGFSRMNDSQHYLHDVIAGATIGIAYGIGMHYRYSATAKTAAGATASARERANPLQFDLVPTLDGGAVFAHKAF